MASSSSTLAREAFEAIAVRIAEVSRLESESSTALEEQRSGGELVLKTLAAMREATKRVEASGASISGAGTRVEAAMESLASASARVVDRASGIAAGAARIETENAEALGMSRNNDECVGRLRAEISRFKT